jgi:hypothetical protein
VECHLNGSPLFYLLGLRKMSDFGLLTFFSIDFVF